MLGVLTLTNGDMCYNWDESLVDKNYIQSLINKSTMNYSNSLITFICKMLAFEEHQRPYFNELQQMFQNYYKHRNTLMPAQPIQNLPQNLAQSVIPMFQQQQQQGQLTKSVQQTFPYQQQTLLNQQSIKLAQTVSTNTNGNIQQKLINSQLPPPYRQAIKSRQCSIEHSQQAQIQIVDQAKLIASQIVTTPMKEITQNQNIELLGLNLQEINEKTQNILNLSQVTRQKYGQIVAKSRENSICNKENIKQDDLQSPEKKKNTQNQNSFLQNTPSLFTQTYSQNYYDRFENSSAFKSTQIGQNSPFIKQQYQEKNQLHNQEIVNNQMQNQNCQKLNIQLKTESNSNSRQQFFSPQARFISTKIQDSLKNSITSSKQSLLQPKQKKNKLHQLAKISKMSFYPYSRTMNTSINLNQTSKVRSQVKKQLQFV